MKETSRYNKSIIGLKKKVHGDLFESLVIFFAERDRFPITKIPEGCRTVKGKLIRIKSPYDFILNAMSKTIFFDAKTTMLKRFPYSSINRDQLKNLALQKNASNLCGYVICFDGEVGFVGVEVMGKIRPGDSITIDDCIHLGTVKNFSFRPLSEVMA